MAMLSLEIVHEAEGDRYTISSTTSVTGSEIRWIYKRPEDRKIFSKQQVPQAKPIKVRLFVWV